eukprot:TRINITY_DN2623_c0_g1_i1.p1 TRINITY_DN2623_c0_g1~~TRINITY_DN2623_c0_g1_i1.p1  ORF type:complete len:266 (+),score=17.71 TRINITY_DN2623_c0_g1_i1:36-800(+)
MAIRLSWCSLLVVTLIVIVVGYNMGALHHPPDMRTAITPAILAPQRPGDGLATATVAQEGEPWIETVSWSPRIFVYHNILTTEECDHIVELGAAEVTRSQVVGDKGASEVNNARTSYGVFLSKYEEDPVLKKLRHRISDWTHLPEANGETFYLLRYEVGQEYKPHNDYFRDDMDLGAAGNRIATVLTYLSTPESGGETVFPNAGLQVKATKGNAVLFWDITPDGKSDPMSLHGGNPVISGTKWAMTKWIRAGAL